MSRTLTGWSFWGTRGSRGTEAPARQPGTHVNPLQRAGPIRVRAEIPSATRKRPFLNHAQNQRSRTQNPQQTRPQPPVERGWADKADSRPPLCKKSGVGSSFRARMMNCRVGKGRPAGSIELRVSPSPSKIPYGGFSPVRLQMDRQWRPSTTSRGLSAVHIRPMRPSYTPPQLQLPGIRDPRRDYPFENLSVQCGTTPNN